jgi:hypothetical protein
MKYLCLVYLDDACTPGPAGSEHDAEVSEYRHTLEESGYAVVSSSLQPAETATTIRVRNGRILMEDGPYGDRNELLDGIYLIEAGDLNDAIRIAARMPTARIGSIEIRPVRELEPARPVPEQTANQSRP